MEIALFDPAALEGDLIKECSTEAVDDRALHLRFDGVRMDGDAAIHCTGHALDMNFAVLGDLNFGHLRHEGSEHSLYRDPTARPFRQRLSPPGLLCGEIEHRQRAGGLVKEHATIVYRVLFGCGGELVDEALHDENVAGRANAPPPTRRDSRRLVTHVFNPYVRD